MKNLIFLSLTLCVALFFSTTQAQNKPQRTRKPADKKVIVEPAPVHLINQRRLPAVENALILNEGKMYIIKSGQAYPFNTEATLPNGTTLRQDGTLIHKDGRQQRLRQDQYLTEKGELLDWRPEETTKPANQK